MWLKSVLSSFKLALREAYTGAELILFTIVGTNFNRPHTECHGIVGGIGQTVRYTCTYIAAEIQGDYRFPCIERFGVT